jgi:hypothetical protein
MQDAAFNRSPCIRQCCLDGQDICMGCGRSLAEILAWQAADPAEQAAIRVRAEARREDRRRRFAALHPTDDPGSD